MEFLAIPILVIVVGGFLAFQTIMGRLVRIEEHLQIKAVDATRPKLGAFSRNISEQDRYGRRSGPQIAPR